MRAVSRPGFLPESSIEKPRKLGTVLGEKAEVLVGTVNSNIILFYKSSLRGFALDIVFSILYSRFLACSDFLSHFSKFNLSFPVQRRRRLRARLWRRRS